MVANAKEVAKAAVDKNAMQLVDDRPTWASDKQRGSEDVGIKDIILPRVDVLQALSPQLKKSDPAFIPGAEQGTFFNTLSRQIYGAEITFIPVVFRREWLVWGDRNSGGGFNGSYNTEAEGQAKVLELQGNGVSADVVETHVHFVLIVAADGTTEEAVFSWSRSKIKASRKLNSLVHMTGSDRFAGSYKLRAIEVSGAKGDYWSADVQFKGYHAKELFDRGLATYEAVQGGARGVDHNEEAATPETAVL